jgi:hypothetical protein
MEESSSSLQPDLFEFPPDQCIFCVSKGIVGVSAAEKQLPEGPVPYPREICNGQEFEKVYA